jgi:crotonobetainyl-CoA:carnitine CoA-transferase CaiB-like acyl-CoA transferase
VENDEQWKGFCQAIGEPPWTKDERFSDALSRWKNREELDKFVETWTAQYNHYEAMGILQKARVPSGAVLSMREIHLDPQFVNRGFFEIVDHGEGVGKRPILQQIPAKFIGVENSVPRRAPRFGQDNEYVFCTLLGMSKDDLKRLEDEKVVGGTPVFPPGRPTRVDLIEKQEAGWFDPDYLAEIRKRHGEDIGAYEAPPGEKRESGTKHK